MNVIAIPLKKRAQKSPRRDPGELRQDIEEIEYDAEVVKILRAASETEPVVPPQDTEEFFKFLHKHA